MAVSFIDTARYWSKIAIFWYLPYIMGVPIHRSEYCLSIWYVKTRMMCLPDSEISSFNRILCDRRTSCHAI